MNPIAASRWERVQTIFHAAAELPPELQAQAVFAQSDGDLTLADTVLEMLDEDRRSASLLDSGVGDLAQAVLRGDSVESLLEQRIASYRLIRLLGEGGTGVVYLAERPELGRTVAIKLLRHAWLSPMRRQRFAIEQQMLGQLNHPGIAPIYDAGTLSDGTPWFVMEYIDGIPLTQFLARRAGTILQDLQLFRQLCAAVRYAHSHAIVHRDLKPSNVLVTASGEPRLIDFGIAKQLHPDPEDDRQGHATRTMEGLSMMTPAYAAPEQRNGGDIGVFTDIYALGVMLYEILTGSLPAPAGPSQLPASPSSLAPARATLPRRHWHDLDLLTLTALAPEPKARYRSVDALLYDLDAYLEDRPLLARPPSRREALFKFARRHRAGLAATAAGLIFLIAATVLFTVRLARARNTALAETARVVRLQHFTESLFDGGDPEDGPATDLRASDMLRRGEAQAGALNQDPRLQTSMLLTLGTAWQKTGSLDKANILLEQALSQTRRQLGPQSPEYIQSLLALASLRKDQRQLDQAESLYQQAATSAGAIHDDPTMLRALTGLGAALSLHGRYNQSQAALDQAAQLIQHTHTPDQFLEDELLTEQANLAFYRGDYDQAQPLFLQAIALGRKLYGNNHPKVAQKLNGLGHIEKNLGHLAQAESIYREALAADTAWYGPDHPDVATDLVALGSLLGIRGQHDEAEVLLHRALASLQHVYGEVHPRVAEAWNEVAVLAYARDRDDESEAATRKALAIYLAVYGPNHQTVGLQYNNLAGDYTDRKDYPTAERYLRQALNVYAASLSDDHPNPATAHIRLGRVLLHQQRYTEAAPETLKGLHYFLVHHVQGSSYVTGARKDLAEDARHLTDPALQNLIAQQIAIDP